MLCDRDGFKEGLVERLPCPPEKPKGHDRVPQNLGDTIGGHDFRGHDRVPGRVPKRVPYRVPGGTRSCPVDYYTVCW